MTSLLDGFLVQFLVGIPVVGAIFVTLMPSSDRIALRHVGMGATIATAFVALRVLWRGLSDDATAVIADEAVRVAGLILPVHLDGINVVAVFGCALVMPMALRAGAPKIVDETKGYVAGMLVCEALALAAMCAANPLTAFAFASALTFPLMLLLGLAGGPSKGSTALQMGTLWAVVDAFALASLVWLEVLGRRNGLSVNVPHHFDVIASLSLFEQAVLTAPLLLAATTRLACLPLTAWVDPFFDDAPVSVAAVICGVVMPLGAVLAFRFGLAWMPRGGLFWLPMLAVLSIITAALGGIRAWVERDLRRHASGIVEVTGAVTLAGLCTMGPFGVSAAIIFVTASGLALALYLFVIDAMERRYVTRDSAELVGLSDELPGLWRLFVLSNLAIVGVPLLAGGTAMWMLLVAVFETSVLHVAGAPASLSMWLALSLLGASALCALGASNHLRRTSAPQVKINKSVPSPFTPGQAVRLWIPVLFVGAIGLLTTTATPKLLPAITDTLDHIARTLDQGPPGRRFDGFRDDARAKAATTKTSTTSRSKQGAGTKKVRGQP